MQFATMPDGEDWLMAPVLSGMCHYESLLDGRLSMVDIARMNDALATKNINQMRWDRAVSRGNT